MLQENVSKVTEFCPATDFCSKYNSDTEVRSIQKYPLMLIAELVSLLLEGCYELLVEKQHNIVCQCVIPITAASNCPWSIEIIPPRTISDISPCVNHYDENRSGALIPNINAVPVNYHHACTIISSHGRILYSSLNDNCNF